MNNMATNKLFRKKLLIVLSIVIIICSTKYGNIEQMKGMIPAVFKIFIAFSYFVIIILVSSSISNNYINRILGYISFSSMTA